MHDIIGHTYRDRITGFQGVATGRVEYITGCNQILLSPPVADCNGRPAPEWFDDQRLERVAGSLRIELDNGSNPGCDRPAPHQ